METFKLLGRENFKKLINSNRKLTNACRFYRTSRNSNFPLKGHARGKQSSNFVNPNKSA